MVGKEKTRLFHEEMSCQQCNSDATHSDQLRFGISAVRWLLFLPAAPDSG
jgi:hypothetical protein